MNELYFPSCNFTKASPEAARRLRMYLREKMPVAGCCRTDRLEYPEDSLGLYFCQACRETLEARAPGKFTLENLFVWLVEQEDFAWPDYRGLTATVQDCWRDREHPEIFDAVRQALARMGVTVVEMDENRERSVFCGNLHFEPRQPANVALLEACGDTPLFRCPEEVQLAMMREQAEKIPCGTAVAYCNRCKAGLLMAGVPTAHLMELAMGTWQG